MGEVVTDEALSEMAGAMRDTTRSDNLNMGRAVAAPVECTGCEGVVTDGDQYLYMDNGTVNACLCRTCLISAAMAIDEVELHDRLTGTRCAGRSVQ